MQVTVRGVDAEIAKIRKYLKDSRADAGSKLAVKIVNELIAATPIDTGEARSGWHHTLTKDGVRITNNVPYIEALNNGHSQQAPSHFIEKVLLSHGKALGTIVVKNP